MSKDLALLTHKSELRGSSLEHHENGILHKILFYLTMLRQERY
jgi:hypothetical protein